MKKSEKLLLNRIKKIIEETSDIDTQTLADKLNITNDECIELLNNLGIDIINENINDELKECEELIKVNIDEKNQYVKNFWILLVTNYQIGLRPVIEVLVSKLS